MGRQAVFAYDSGSFAGSGLWTTDGTPDGTTDLSGTGATEPILDPGGLLSNDKLVFTDNAGLEVTDGTASGTSQLKAGLFGYGSYPFHLASLGSIVVFGVASGPDYSDASGGDQLWRTDGTSAGTFLVTDLPRDSAYAGITAFESLGGEALFSYDDGSAPDTPALWVTDGTAAGTFEIPGITYPQFGAVAGSRAILIGFQGLVATDGTVAGTSVIAPEIQGPGGFGPSNIMASLGNKVIFAGGDPTDPDDPYERGPLTQLWETDGTAAGTTLIETLPSFNNLAGITSMVSDGDHVLFTYSDGKTDSAIWTTDGTSNGTAILIDHTSTYFDEGSVAELVPCFASGTRVATQRGPIAVERLRVGDVVMTASGGRQTIAWIGRRHVDCRRHGDQERVWPVRIAVHAFGDGRPQRPLLLSPDHSVFVEDVLIPIKFLVNGSTVAQIGVDDVTYFHIELPRHDILLAEGLPTESYLETGGRSAFENGGGATDLHPDFGPDEKQVAMVWQSSGCAPLLGSDGQLDRVRLKLQMQAEMLRHAPRQSTKKRQRSA